MFRTIVKPLKKAALVFLTLPGISGCITRCPDAEIDAVLASIPDPENKNDGADLKGWEYKKARSERSGETYYYYHMPARKADAPIFVLLHGMFLDGRTFLNFGALAEDFELFAPELPHQSPFFHGQVEDFPHLLQDFLDTVGIERMYLGGVSLGGQIAMFYMVYGQKTPVDGLLLITTDMVKSDDALADAKKNAERLLKITKDDDRRMICLLHKLSLRKVKNADASEQEVMKVFAVKHPSFYRQVLYTARNMKAPPNLKQITVPTLIVLSDADSTIPFDSAQHLTEVIPGSTMKVVKGGEHSAAFTRADEVVGYVRDKFSMK